MAYRIVIVDDHPLMRRALESIIEDEPDFIFVSQATNGAEAVSLVLETNPDCVVMDLLMPVMDGVAAIQEILQQRPETHILALSSTTDEEKVLDAIQVGALGFLSKESQPPEILTAIRLVAQGEFYLQKELTQKLLKNIGTTRKQESASTQYDTQSLLRNLTEREVEILDLMATGLSNKLIAQQLVLSEATVRSHTYHILNKLGLENRNQAIVFALKK